MKKKNAKKIRDMTLKSKGFYRTGGHFTGLVRMSDGISFSLQHVHFISCSFHKNVPVKMEQKHLFLANH
jgi:hypothetical protein